MNQSRPQARQIREREQAADRQQLRVISLPEQSASASKTLHQAWQQSVPVRDKDRTSPGFGPAVAMDTNSPQTGRNPELSTSEAAFPTSIGCEPNQPQARPRRRIAVAVTRLIRFRVHIRSI
jgi:hypothetical protein